MQHVPAAEKRLSEGKNSFNQSRASPPWGLRSCRAGMLKGKSHTKAQKDKAPQAAAAAAATAPEGWRGTRRDTQGWTREGQAARPVPGEGEGFRPRGTPGDPRAAQPRHWAGLAADWSLLPPLRKCSGVTCPEVLSLLLLLL